MAIDLSRIGEEFVLWTSEEFGFARLDAYATGSSMLPQKKNPTSPNSPWRFYRLIGNHRVPGHDERGCR